jgi:hypothetical protein
MQTDNRFQEWLQAATARGESLLQQHTHQPIPRLRYKLRRAAPVWYEQFKSVQEDTRRKFIARRWSYRPRNGYKSGYKSE